MRMSDLFGQRFGRPNVYYPELRHVTGSNNATIFMCKLLFWSDKGSDPDGWIYKTMEEMTVETGLSRREQEGARKLLVERGLLYEKFKGIPRKLFFFVDRDKLDELGDEWFYGDNNEQNQHNVQNSHYCMAESANKERLKPPSNKTQNSHSLYNRDDSKDDNREKESPPKNSKSNPGETLTPTSQSGLLGTANTINRMPGRKNPEKGNKNSSVDVVGDFQRVSTDQVAEVAETVISYLNKRTGANNRPADSVKLIAGCMRQGMTVADLTRIVDNVQHWKDSPKDRIFLRPSHLFGPQAPHLSALPPGINGSVLSGKKRQYYLENPNGNPNAVLIDENEIAVGTDAWDKEGRRIVL